MKRTTIIGIGMGLFLAAGLFATNCSSEGGGTTGTGGKTGAGGSTTGAGGSATGAGGSATGAGGSTTGAGGAGGSNVALCPTTISDKVTPCVAGADVCPKTCGVESKGSKTCTCTGGVYVCDAAVGACKYPAGTDLACYKLPATVAACGTPSPVSNSACTAGDCMACSGYLDSGMVAKTGFCVCVGVVGAKKWRCASDKEWPPQ
jgi:hypothetical protein